ncbi:DUF1254 domain-containing protein [Kaistia terrae]|uniref:DUF1254 domain-containing protein n=1 Tax=Kaistia terrae TaxID=537017 RepID=A0ABW0Q322_9HYPH|nr:DUF1254 domain-containing protein [Kaistia terrae]MCX5578575.1 DUF1254 domain-containing protein [Kaistia terrae]
MTNRSILFLAAALAIGTTSLAARAAETSAPGAPVLVTPDNFVRAESDRYFAGLVKKGGVGKFNHTREPAPIDDQTVVRLNRDTLYSSAVIDLDAGPATITLPDTGKRFISLQVIDEDQYTHAVHYKPGQYTLNKDDIGTRYVVVGIRTLADPGDAEDMKAAHAIQDALKIEQKAPGSFDIPNWDQTSQDKVRQALIVLASTLPDTNRMFGMKDKVDPVRRLIGSASAWGGNPETEAIYLNVTPTANDGKTIYKLDVRDVPVDGFWSVSVYNADGYYEKNDLNAYSLNDITAKKSADGSVAIQFGGCDGKVVNCLPTVAGWNYMVRLYRPHSEILAGKWTFPEAQPQN